MGVSSLQTSLPDLFAEGTEGAVCEDAGAERGDGVFWGADASRCIGRGWSGSVASAAYWRGFLEETPNVFAPNLDTRAGVMVVEGSEWPITVGEGASGNSYPCSLRTQYVRYPRAELGLVPGVWM
jgi:hypothetical protein